MIASLTERRYTIETKQKRGRNALGFFGLGAALLVCCLFSALIAFSYISFLLFLSYVIYHVVAKPKIVLKYLYFYFAVVSNVVGVAACEFTNVYLPEMYVVSHFAGSLPLIVFSRWLFLELVEWFDGRFAAAEYKSSASNAWYDIKKYEEGKKYYILLLNGLNVFVLGLTAVLCAHLARHPSFMISVDRIEYSELYLSGIWGSISSVLSALIVVSIIRLRIRVNAVSILAILLYVLSLFLSGVKFGGYFSLLCAFTIIYYDKIAQMNSRRLKSSVFGIACAAVLLITSAAITQTSYSQVNPIEYLAARTAQQGELWWRTYDLFSVEPHLEQLDIELSNLTTDESVSESVGATYGIYGAMYRTVPSYYVDRYLAGGARYTEAGYAVALYCIGLFGPMLYSVVMAFGAALIQNGLFRSIVRGRLFSAVLIYRLYLALCTALGMFTFGQFFSIISLITYGFLAVASLGESGFLRGSSRSIASMRGR